MKFSVIIPCYNCETTLAGTVRSVQNAGLNDYEIILVDDGSQDGTLTLCEKLTEQFPEIRCFHQENAGVSAARNRGIDLSRGEYILFMDADDEMISDTLGGVWEKLQEHSPDILFFGIQFDYLHRGRMYRSDQLLPPALGFFYVSELIDRFEDFYNNNALSSACNKLWRRDFLMAENLKFQNGMILMEDLLFVLDALPYCKSIYCLPVAAYRYRQAEDEKNAYRRLQRIVDLGAYMKPFENSVKALNLPDGRGFVENLYRMLLSQKLYWADKKEIEEALLIHKNGPYSSIPFETDPKKLYWQNQKSHLRHKVAVEVKTLLYGKKSQIHENVF